MQPQSQSILAGQMATFAVTATGTAPLSYQWSADGAPIGGATGASYTTLVNSVTNTGSTFTVTVKNPYGTVTSAAATLNVSQLAPTLSFSPIGAKTYGNAPFPVTASSASSGAITYSVVSGPATIAGNVVTVTGAGTVVLSASQAPVGNYTAATATTSFTVGSETPTLAFGSIGSETYGNAPFPVTASSASSGAITYSVVSGPATIAGNVVTVTGVGTVVLSASQAATPDYTAATATTSFTVGSKTPTLAFSPIGSETYGNAPFPVTASSASSGTITYSVVSGPATLAGNVVTVTGVGTVVLTASQAATTDYTAATATTSFTVGSETPTLAFSPIGTETYGNAPFAVTASSASSGAITYSVASGPATIAGNVVTVTGVGTVVLHASQAATTDYTVATATTSFTVNGEAPTLSFNTIPAETYGNAPFVVTASSASSGAVTYSVVSGPATIVGNEVTLTGAGPVEIMASQAASGNYTAATAITTFTVAGETPTITFPSPGTQAYSATPFAVQATSNSPAAITYSVVSGPATIAGNMVTMTGGGTVVLSANQAASGNYGTGTATTSFAITATAPVITLQPVSANICQGQTVTLSVQASNATAYQWYFKGAVISGADNPTYSIGDATSSQTGDYTVEVSNPTESVTSQVATVNVGSTIVTNPANLTITQYQEGSFSVAATGSGHYTYQWYEVPYGGTATPATGGTGATSNLYVTQPQSTVTTSGEPTSYYAEVTDTTCNATLQSNSATLTVDAGNSPPTITIQPVGQTVTAGNSATFTAAAVGSGTITYQWYRIPGAGTNAEITGTTPATGTAVSGATSATYTVPTSSTEDSNDQDVYYVVATNAYGSAVSQHATLAVDQGIQIQITNEPTNQYVNAGESATFSVTATSTAPLTYQWYTVPPGESAAAQTTYTLQDGTPTETTGTANAVAISGATGSSYTVPNASASQTGTVYYVVVSNGQTSQVYSNTASLTVGQPNGISSCASNWNMLGTTSAITCGYELVNGALDEQGEIVWPTLISTGNLQLSFTITTSDTTSPPADGFSMVLGDPSLGATLQSVGLPGEGIGAKGLPGFVLAFDDYYNAACTSGCYPTGSTYPADPSTSSNPDYLGVGRGEPSEWENPYFNTNLNLPIPAGDTYSLAQNGETITHSYVVSIVSGYMSVTMDGTQVFSGNVTVPPVAYLYLTASTGGAAEEVQITNISATVNAPSN